MRTYSKQVTQPDNWSRKQHLLSPLVITDDASKIWILCDEEFSRIWNYQWAQHGVKDTSQKRHATCLLRHCKNATCQHQLERNLESKCLWSPSGYLGTGNWGKYFLSNPPWSPVNTQAMQRASIPLWQKQSHQTDGRVELSSHIVGGVEERFCKCFIKKEGILPVGDALRLSCTSPLMQRAAKLWDKRLAWLDAFQHCLLCALRAQRKRSVLW